MKNELAKIIVDLYRKDCEVDIDIQDVSFLFFSSRMSDILFVFIKGNKQPKYVLKVSQDEIKIEHIKKEWDILTGISRFNAGILHKTFPLPLYSGVVNGHYLFVEEACKGIPLVNFMYSKRNKRKEICNVLRSTTEWISELHRVSFLENVSIDNFLSAGWVMKIIESFGSLHNLTDQENQFIRELMQLNNLKVPLVTQHSDFSPYNMFCDKTGKALFVLDWQYSVLRGSPLVDLLNFLVFSQSLLSNPGRSARKRINLKSFFANIYNILPDQDDFINTFYGNGWFSRFASDCIKEYCNKISLDRGVLRLIFILFIFRHLYNKKDFFATFVGKGDPVFIKAMNT
ncbi:MAG: hypothetical protein NTZ63_02365 [Candidatus Omnitrophica bacterium]|nr:hypothetical protein [Candidatus Omnitrophota bacterium]